MMDDIITVIFRYLNTGILVGLCYYVFKKYGMPWLQDSRQQDLRDRTIIETRLRNTQHDHDALQQKLQRDEQACTILKRKLLVWKEHVVKDRQRMNDEIAVLHVQMDERIKKQTAAYQQYMWQKQVVVPAWRKAQSDLRDVFDHAENQQQYLAQLISVMEDRL